MSPVQDLSRTIVRFAVAAAGVLWLTASSPAQETLNPKRYHSPSREYELRVDPTNREGAGKAHYAMTRKGQTVWEGAREFALWDALVTDDGRVAGYAYDAGQFGWVGPRGESNLLVTILDAEGKTTVVDRRPREPSRRVLTNPPSPAEPLAQGIMADVETDTLVIRIRPPLAGEKYEWWRYRLSTGKKLGDVTPDQPGADERSFHKEIAAERVPGTPLLLVHWYTYHDDGARFSLLALDGTEVWGLSAQGEYAGLGERWNWSDLVGDDQPQIQAVPSGFSVRSRVLQQRMDLAVVQDLSTQTGWRVIESGREAQKDPPAPVGEKAHDEAVQRLDLEFLGEIQLATPDGDRGPIHDIHDFRLDDRGRIGFLRIGGDNTSLVLIEPDGRVVREVPLPEPLDDGRMFRHFCWLSGDRWLMTLSASKYRESGPPLAWLVNAGTGVVEPMGELTCPSIDALAPRPDGGFAARTERAIVVFGPDGKEQSRAPGGGLLDGLAALTDGRFAAVSSVEKAVYIFGPDGALQSSVDLESAWGRTPNYPSNVTADRTGGYIVGDFNGQPPVVRMRADGTVHAEFQPRGDDGRTFRLRGGVQVAPDGTIWTSDGHSMLSLSESGVVDRVLGATMEDDALDRIRALTVGEAGRIYAVNERTAAVHVFGRDGKLLRICRPDPTDFKSEIGFGHITIDGDGVIHYYPHRNFGLFEPTKYLAIAADGSRLGFKEPLFPRSTTETWHYKPGTKDLWVVADDKLHLVSEDRATVRTIERRPDRSWFGRIDGAAVAADGSVAVLSFDRKRDGGGEGGWALSIYGPGGDATTLLTLPGPLGSDRFAFDGGRVVLACREGICIVRVSDGRIQVAPTPNEGQNWWSVHLPPGGDEVWLREAEARSLRRFRLPSLEQNGGNNPAP